MKRLATASLAALLLSSSEASAEEAEEDRESVHDHQGFVLKLSAGAAYRLWREQEAHGPRFRLLGANADGAKKVIARGVNPIRFLFPD